MLKVLLAAWGSAGDVAPFIGIGRQLRERGHEVTLIALPVFERATRAADLDFRGVGTVAVFERLASRDFWSFDEPLGPEALSFLTRDLPPVRVDQYYDAILDLHEPGRTVVVTQKRATGAYLAHHDLGVPLAAVELSPSGLAGLSHPPWPLPAWLRAMGSTGRRAGWGAMRLRQGLERRLRGAAFPLSAVDAAVEEHVRRWRSRRPEPSSPREPAPRRELGAWPPWFAPGHGGPDVDLVGFIFQGEGSDRPPPDAEPARPGGEARPIVFTTGSVAGSQHEFFAAAVEAARLLDRPAVLVTRYEDQLPRPLPRGVTHVAYAPFDELFRTAAAVVHHGGIGTIALALAAGVPQVARPMARDQFDNADRMERLGVGRMIGARGMEPRALARALDAMLASQGVAERCAHWRSRLDPDAGAKCAADRIEALASAG